MTGEGRAQVKRPEALSLRKVTHGTGRSINNDQTGSARPRRLNRQALAETEQWLAGPRSLWCDGFDRLEERLAQLRPADRQECHHEHRTGARCRGTPLRHQSLVPGPARSGLASLGQAGTARRMETPEGGTSWFRFVYRDIAKPERLVWMHSFVDTEGEIAPASFLEAWPRELLATVRFEEAGNATQVMLTSKPVGRRRGGGSGLRGVDAGDGGWLGRQLRDAGRTAGADGGMSVPSGVLPGAHRGLRHQRAGAERARPDARPAIPSGGCSCPPGGERKAAIARRGRTLTQALSRWGRGERCCHAGSQLWTKRETSAPFRARNVQLSFELSSLPRAVPTQFAKRKCSTSPSATT